MESPWRRCSSSPALTGANNCRSLTTGVPSSSSRFSSKLPVADPCLPPYLPPGRRARRWGTRTLGQRTDSPRSVGPLRLLRAAACVCATRPMTASRFPIPGDGGGWRGGDAVWRSPSRLPHPLDDRVIKGSQVSEDECQGEWKLSFFDFLFLLSS